MTSPCHFEFEELYKAYEDCRKRKVGTEECMLFDDECEINLYDLYKDLVNGRYEIGKSKTFCVTRPKLREVFAANFKDRIVHHFLMNRLMPLVEEEFIDNTFSCRVGKGTFYGVCKLHEMISEATLNYTKKMIIVKGDFKSFFMRINKDILYKKIEKFIIERYVPRKEEGDLSFVLSIAREIIYNRPQDNCIRKQPISMWDGLDPEKSLFKCEENRGVPIGNLPSQIFANLYLSDFDHYIVDELRKIYYGRYVDDFYLILESIEEWRIIRPLLVKKLEEVEVELHPNKISVQDAKKGIKFIGGVTRPFRVYVSNRNTENFKNMISELYEALIKTYEEGLEPTFDDLRYVESRINSYLGFMRHYKSFNIRRNILSSKKMKPWFKYFYVDKDLTKVILYRDYYEMPSRKISKLLYKSKLTDEVKKTLKMLKVKM